jgi:serine/threonine protein phosphatase 1
VVDRLAKNPFSGRYVALAGNHEAVLFDFLADSEVASFWRDLGGLETLHSYGVSVKSLLRGKGFKTASAEMKAAIPPPHRKFFSTLKSGLQIGDFFLCHAGVRPGVALKNQKVDDLLWIRDEFLNSTADFGKVVIHGHSPIEWPEVRPNRINIDTGAFATGRLTCLVIDGPDRRFLYS